MGRHAIVSMMMRHSVGTLSAVLNIISRYGYSVWTITQNPPVDSRANVVITLELGEDPKTLDRMLKEITFMLRKLKARLPKVMLQILTMKVKKTALLFRAAQHKGMTLKLAQVALLTDLKRDLLALR